MDIEWFFIECCSERVGYGSEEREKWVLRKGGGTNVLGWKNDNELLWWGK